MEIDSLGIRSNGDLCFASGGYWNNETGKHNDYVLMPEFKDNEVCTYTEMNKRIAKLASEIIG